MNDKRTEPADRLARAVVVGLILVCGTILFSVGLVWLAATIVHGTGPGVRVEINQIEAHHGVCRPCPALENP